MCFLSSRMKMKKVIILGEAPSTSRMLRQVCQSPPQRRLMPGMGNHREGFSRDGQWGQDPEGVGDRLQRAATLRAERTQREGVGAENSREAVDENPTARPRGRQMP